MEIFHVLTMFKKVQRFLIDQFRDFGRSDFLDSIALRKAIGLYLAWATASCAFVLVVEVLATKQSVAYLRKAIEQGVGPELWNVVGVFGFSLFGASVLFPRCCYIAQAAHHVLETTFGIGSLMFGLLLGQVVNAFSLASVEAWQAWFWGVSFVVLFAIVSILNMMVWSLSYLAGSHSQEVGFLCKFCSVSGFIRVPVAIAVASLPLFLLLAER